MSTDGRRAALRFWVTLGAAYALIATCLTIVGAPSTYLFSGVIAGALMALRSRAPQALPAPVQQFGLATVGIAAGSQIDGEVMSTLLEQPWQILAFVCGTMVVTMFCGQMLRCSKDISWITALFASIAGAASGVTAVVREAGGDDAVVMAVQYLRVVAVLVTVPIVAGLLGATSTPDSDTPAPYSMNGIAFTAVALLVGLALAHVLSFSASRLVLPLLVATGLSVGDVAGPAAVPPVILAAGYSSIGLMVGLSMTPETVRLLARIMPLAFIHLVVSLTACAGLGVAMARLMDVSDVDGYLASTPGGLPAVAAIAIGSGASIVFVVTVQLLRVFLALVVAALLGEWISRRSPGGAASRDPI